MVTHNVVAGQTYTLWVSVYSPSYNLNFTTPFDFYSTGNVVFGTYTGRNPIDTAQAYYLASQLGITVDPIFVGGTLRMDRDGASYSQDFSLGNMTSNTIDQNGVHSIFSGIFSDAVAGRGGYITISNSSTGGSVTFTGRNTYSGATILADGGVLRVSEDINLGASSAQVIFNGGTLHYYGSFETSRQHVLNSAGGTIEVAGGQTVTINTGMTGSGSFTKSQSGTLILNGNNTYTGSTSVTGGALIVGDSSHSSAILGSGSAAITISQGASIGGYGTINGMVSNSGVIAAGSASSGMSGSSVGNLTINGGVTNNGGTIQLAGGTSVGNSLTINGSLSGTGSINMNAYSDANGSSSDLLIISGAGNTTSGSHAIYVTNTGPGGAPSGNGTALVTAQNGAAIGQGSFYLGSSVKAGPYEYMMSYGALDGSDPNSIYLHNWRVNASGQSMGVPNYNTDVSLFGAAMGQAQKYGRSMIGTMHDRMGGADMNPHPDLLMNMPGRDEQVVYFKGQQNPVYIKGRAETSRQTEPEFFAGAWGRVVGEHSEWDSKEGVYGKRGAEFEQDMYAIQTGLELFRRESAAGSVDKAGLYVGIGHSDSEVKHFDGRKAGNNKFDAYSVGAYWSHFGAAGWYTDAVVQGTFLFDRNGIQVRQNG